MLQPFENDPQSNLFKNVVTSQLQVIFGGRPRPSETVVQQRWLPVDVIPKPTDF